jgi:hypothetical protein
LRKFNKLWEELNLDAVALAREVWRLYRVELWIILIYS